MKKYRHSKSSLFLLEIMLNILFFTVLVTICLQLFFKAHHLSTDTAILHKTATTCNSIAEVYQSAGNGEEMILNIYPKSIILNNTIILYFDRNFTACAEFESAYRAVLSKDANTQLLHISFLRKDETEAIYQLDVSSYLSKTLGELAGGDNP